MFVEILPQTKAKLNKSFKAQHHYDAVMSIVENQMFTNYCKRIVMKNHFGLTLCCFFQMENPLTRFRQVQNDLDLA